MSSTPPVVPPVAPEAAPPVAPTATPTEAAQDRAIVVGNRVPSNWNIRPLEEDLIEASNSTTGATFEGTVEAFNKKYLRV